MINKYLQIEETLTLRSRTSQWRSKSNHVFAARFHLETTELIFLGTTAFLFLIELLVFFALSLSEVFKNDIDQFFIFVFDNILSLDLFALIKTFIDLVYLQNIRLLRLHVIATININHTKQTFQNIDKPGVSFSIVLFRLIVNDLRINDTIFGQFVLSLVYEIIIF